MRSWQAAFVNREAGIKDEIGSARRGEGSIAGRNGGCRDGEFIAIVEAYLWSTTIDLSRLDQTRFDIAVRFGTAISRGGRSIGAHIHYAGGAVGERQFADVDISNLDGSSAVDRFLIFGRSGNFGRLLNGRGHGRNRERVAAFGSAGSSRACIHANITIIGHIGGSGIIAGAVGLRPLGYQAGSRIARDSITGRVRGGGRCSDID